MTIVRDSLINHYKMDDIKSNRRIPSDIERKKSLK